MLVHQTQPFIGAIGPLVATSTAPFAGMPVRAAAAPVSDGTTSRVCAACARGCREPQCVGQAGDPKPPAEAGSLLLLGQCASSSVRSRRGVFRAFSPQLVRRFLGTFRPFRRLWKRGRWKVLDERTPCTLKLLKPCCYITMHATAPVCAGAPLAFFRPPFLSLGGPVMTLRPAGLPPSLPYH